MVREAWIAKLRSQCSLAMLDGAARGILLDECDIYGIGLEQAVYGATHHSGKMARAVRSVCDAMEREQADARETPRGTTAARRTCTA